MSFHTFEMTKIITDCEYRELARVLGEKGKLYPKQNAYVSDYMQEQGIRIKLIQTHKGEWTYNMLQIIVNPRRLIHDDDYIGVFNSNDNLEHMFETLEGVLADISKTAGNIRSYRLTRIDFTENIHFDTPQKAEMYISLLKRAKIPKGFSEYKVYSKKGKRMVKTKEGIVLTKKNEIKVNFYNKQLQMKKIKMPYSDTSGIVRLELQCFRKAIEKFEDKDIIGILQNEEKYAQKLFSKYIGKLYGTGDFYKFEKAAEMVQNSKYRIKTKENMHMLICETAQHKSLDKGIKEVAGNKKLIEKFNKTGVSPITVPRRWQIEYMETPLKLIDLKTKENT